MALVRRVKPKIPQPPPIANGDGRKFMRMTEPERQVTLDAGVFDYLWRILESRHEQALNRPGQHPEHEALLERAVGSFRRAATADPEGTLEELKARKGKGIPVRVVASREEFNKATKEPVRRRVVRRT
jgi:hypothetical protein